MRWLAGVIVACLVAQGAFAEERLALLIGNEDYPAEVGRLSLPHDDVATLEGALEDVGFSVVTRLDADEAAMEAEIAAFARRLEAAGDDAVGFFYYSGHGASTTVGGRRRNFLMPARETITSGAALRFSGVRLDYVVDTLADSGARAVFVVADACRNTLAWSDDRGGERGFAAEPARSGVLIAQSTAEDETAPDDGAFAHALATQIRTPGRIAELSFVYAYREVARTRDQYRQPTTRGSLNDDFCFAGCDGAPAPPPVTSDTSPDDADDDSGGDADQLVFASAESPCEYAMFARDFPDSPLISLARARAGDARPCDEKPGPSASSEDAEEVIAPPSRPSGPCASYTGPRLTLRSQPSTLSWDQLADMFEAYGFTGAIRTPARGETVYGGAFRDTFVNDGQTVEDCATGLMWLRSTHGPITPAGAQAHARELNASGGYLGYSDWRVPTAEELASLTQPRGRQVANLNTPLHLDAAFDPRGYYVQSSDRLSEPATGESGVLVVTWTISGTWGNMRESDTYPVKLVRTMD